MVLEDWGEAVVVVERVRAIAGMNGVDDGVDDSVDADSEAVTCARKRDDGCDAIDLVAAAGAKRDIMLAILAGYCQNICSDERDPV